MNDIYTFSMIISIATFILTTHITPGPTNIILLSSVLNFGYKKSFPYMFANIISYPLLMIFTAIGVGIFLTKHPEIMSVLKIIGVGYLFWMAWKIFNDSSSYDTNNIDKTKPITFWQGLIYPWVNPKAWIVYTSTVSVFVTSTEKGLSQISLIVFIILITMIITVYSWAFGAIVLKKLIKNEKFIKRLNQIMAVLLVASILPII